MDDSIIYGIAGTVVSGSGVATIAEAENIWYSRIGFIITVIGFIISVVVPFILKIVKKIKEAKADGHITEEEAKDIMNTVIEDGKDVLDQAKEITNKNKEK